MSESNWEQQALRDLLVSSLKEQRSRRRWGIFFKLVFIAMIIAAVWGVTRGGAKDVLTAAPHTALIKIDGPIMADSTASADNIVSGLRAAYKSKGTKGIILRINSPGGSPVQSHYVYNEIMRLRAKTP